jgi:hypothetical protein
MHPHLSQSADKHLSLRALTTQHRHRHDRSTPSSITTRRITPGSDTPASPSILPNAIDAVNGTLGALL